MTEMKKVSEMEPDEIKDAVRKAYSKVATGENPETGIASSCCDEPAQQTSSSCCPPEVEEKVTRVNLADALGYDTEGMPVSATD